MFETTTVGTRVEVKRLGKLEHATGERLRKEA